MSYTPAKPATESLSGFFPGYQLVYTHSPYTLQGPLFTLKTDSDSDNSTECKEKDVSSSSSAASVDSTENVSPIAEMIGNMFECKSLKVRRGGCKKGKMKSKICEHWQRRCCPYGSNCAYAHGERELRVKTTFL